MADGEGVLRIEDRDRVRVLTLNRPEQLNAFNDDLYDAVCDALNRSASDPNGGWVAVPAEDFR